MTWERTSSAASARSVGATLACVRAAATYRSPRVQPPMWLFDNDFDGHVAQRYFASHPLLPACVVVAYLGMVRVGPRWMEQRPPFRLRTVSRVWNLLVAIFSLCGAAVCVPHLIRVLLTHGFWYSVCADVYELAGYGPPALWAAAFTWSKLFVSLPAAVNHAELGGSGEAGWGRLTGRNHGEESRRGSLSGLCVPALPL